MSLDISGLFKTTNNISQSNVTNTPTQSSTNSAGAGNSSLSNMMPGSSVSGLVVSSQEGNVTIKLADSSYVTASLKGNISLQEGSQVSFLINSNRNNQVVLSPLFTNLLATSKNVENALNAASLPINERTTAMVTQMMDQGMGIDKEHLGAMYKEVAANPNIDSGVIVRLSQMNLAVNEMNAEQLRLYDNLNHQIAGSVQDITDNLNISLDSLVKEDAKQAVALFDQVIKLVSENESEADKSGEVNTADGIKHVITLNEDEQNGMSSLNRTGELNTEKQALQSLDTKAIAAEIRMEMDSELLDQKELYINENSKLSNLIGKEDFKSFINILGNSIGDYADASLKQLADGNLSPKEALQLINQFMQEEKVDAKVMNEPAVSKLLQSALEEKWLIKPEDFSDKQKVQSFYDQIRNQTEKLTDISTNILGKNAVLTQSASNLNQSLDFLNQLNQTFSYVQIPLKMSNQNANGDLYVYSNKKRFSSEDGSVSAFLHLDMDHLGSIDCYVTMQMEKVSTNFKVADDAVLDLIEANINLLNERLEKRGYSLNASVAISEKETSVLEEIQKELGTGSVPISKMSFDARA